MIGHRTKLIALAILGLILVVEGAAVLVAIRNLGVAVSRMDASVSAAAPEIKKALQGLNAELKETDVLIEELKRRVP